jgi:hypothetical protein
MALHFPDPLHPLSEPRNILPSGLFLLFSIVAGFLHSTPSIEYFLHTSRFLFVHDLYDTIIADVLMACLCIIYSLSRYDTTTEYSAAVKVSLDSCESIELGGSRRTR